MNPPSTQAMQGVTLLEMMIVLAMIGIVAMIGIPQLNNTIQSNRATSTANDLLGHLQLARSEAVRRARDVIFCPSSDGTTCNGNDWTIGWLVHDPLDAEPTLRVSPALRGTILLSGAPASITFTAVGTANNAAFDLSVGEHSRQICLELSGRAFVGNCNL